MGASLEKAESENSKFKSSVDELKALIQEERLARVTMQSQLDIANEKAEFYKRESAEKSNDISKMMGKLM
jgi:hypothetical protein